MVSPRGLAELELEVAGYRLEPLEERTASGWVRRTTVVHLEGGGHEGLGEDVTYEEEDQVRFQRDGAVLPLAGGSTLGACSSRLGALELFSPRCVNVKPSRFGSIAELMAVYEHCGARGIRMYGGGQFELGPGRGQIQYLASLFHPDGPNDVAPGIYNRHDLPASLPASPLEPAPAATGFRWDP